MNPIIVTGMHRSGTSAVARLVQQLGLDVGTDLLPATEGNIYGHFEEGAFIRFHDALIARLFPKRAPFCEWLPLADADFSYSNADREEAASLWKAHQATGGTAWKDPRTSLFLDLWTDVLGDAKVIVCLRHPYQVHLSLLRRGEPFLHVDYSAAIRGWTVYNRRILATIAVLPADRVIVLDVESAFREPRELTTALTRFLAVATPANIGAIAPEVFHFDDNIREALQHFESFCPEAGALYRQLKQRDFLHPAEATASAGTASPIQSDEARLIEFEETQGLRARATKMLIRSIAVDRQRTLALYEQAMRLGAEKDRLIEDLARLNEHLKTRLGELDPHRP